MKEMDTHTHTLTFTFTLSLTLSLFYLGLYYQEWIIYCIPSHPSPSPQAKELDISGETAERALRECGGDVVATMRKMIH